MFLSHSYFLPVGWLNRQQVFFFPYLFERTTHFQQATCLLGRQACPVCQLFLVVSRHRNTCWTGQHVNTFPCVVVAKCHKIFVRFSPDWFKCILGTLLEEFFWCESPGWSATAAAPGREDSGGRGSSQITARPTLSGTMWHPPRPGYLASFKSC